MDIWKAAQDLVKALNDNSGFTMALVTIVYTLVTLAIVLEAAQFRRNQVVSMVRAEMHRNVFLLLDHVHVLDGGSLEGLETQLRSNAAIAPENPLSWLDDGVYSSLSSAGELRWIDDQPTVDLIATGYASLRVAIHLERRQLLGRVGPLSRILSVLRPDATLAHAYRNAALGMEGAIMALDEAGNLRPAPVAGDGTEYAEFLSAGRDYLEFQRRQRGLDTRDAPANKDRVRPNPS